MTETERRGRRKRGRRRRSRSGRSSAWVRRGAGVALVVLPLVAGAVWMLGRDAPSAVTGRAYNVARLALGAGDLDVALIEAERAVEESPSSREARLLLALVLQRRGATERAAALLAEDVRRDRDYDDGRVLLASFAMRDEDYATALALLREAVERDPSPASAWRLLGRIRSRTGDGAGAVSAYERAVERDPEDVRSWLALADVRLARALETSSVVAREQAGRAYGEAERLCRVRLRETSDAAWRLGVAKSLAGRARALRGSSLVEAEEELRTLVAEAGEDVQPTLALASFLSGIGRVSDARDVLESAERRWPGAASRHALADVLASLDESTEAVTVLRRAVASDARDAESRVALVRLLIRLGRFDEAAGELASAPEDVEAVWRLHEAAGDLALRRSRDRADQGDDDGALELLTAARAAYDRALERRPRSMPLRKKRFAVVLEAGVVRPESLPEDEREAAHRYVRDVLELNPSDADALAWSARSLLVEGDPEAARDLLSPAVAEDLPPLDLLRFFGAACERSGRDEQAADAYDRVLARMTRRDDAERDDRGAPPDVWSDAVRGMTRAGRAALAASTAEEAVAAWPGAPELQLQRADALVMAGRPDDALSALAVAAEEPATATRAIITSAWLLERGGRESDAEAQLRAALSSDGDGGLRYALAGLLGRSGRRDEMRDELAAAAAGATYPAQAALRRGDVLLSLDPPPLAEVRAAFLSAAAGLPDSRPALVRLAELAFLDVGAGRADPDSVRDAVRRCREAAVGAPVLDYLDGKLALLDGRAADAVERLRASVAAGVRSVAALYYLGRAEAEDGQAGAAVVTLDRALERAPDERHVRAELALLRVAVAAEALADGRTAEALLLLEDVAESPAASLLLGAARAARAEWDVAEAHARSVLTAHPGDVSGRHLLASVLRRAGGPQRLAEAAGLYEELAAADPDDVGAQVGLATVRAALGETGAAATAFGAAARLRPGDTEILRGLVEALVAAGREREALEHVEAVRRRGTDDLGTGTLQGDLLLHVGQLAEAAAAYRSAADEARADVRPLVGAAAALAAAGRPEEALQLLERRVERCSDARPAWLAIGDLRARSGDLDGARAALDRAAGAALPTSYEILLRGGLAEAEGATERARRLYASSAAEDDLRPATLRRLGALLAAAGETRRALDAHRALLALRPDDPAAWNGQALLLARDGQPARALAAARRAHDLAPDRPEVVDTLGWLLVHEGELSDARPLLEHAVAELGGDARVRFHLGVCLARLGVADEARAQLERALELDPVFPGADAARAQLERLR